MLNYARRIEALALSKTGAIQTFVHSNGAITVSSPGPYTKTIFQVLPTDLSIFQVYKDMWANLWMCPPPIQQSPLWWCGNDSRQTPCQTTSKALGTMLGYTGGSVLGIARATSASFSPSTATTAPRETLTSSSSLESTSSPQAAHQSQQSDRKIIAVGTGVAIPLGMAVIGFLCFLLWKRGRLRLKSTDGTNISGPQTYGWPRRQEHRRELPELQTTEELDRRPGRLS